MNGVGIEFVTFQRVGMIGRILKLFLDAVDLVADTLCQRQQVRRVGGHGLEVQIELPQQIVTPWLRRGSPAFVNRIRWTFVQQCRPSPARLARVTPSKHSYFLGAMRVSPRRLSHTRLGAVRL